MCIPFIKVNKEDSGKMAAGVRSFLNVSEFPVEKIEQLQQSQSLMDDTYDKIRSQKSP